MRDVNFSLVYKSLITRDYFHAGPDPTFNPNLFSEDEEEPYQEASSRATPEAQPPPIAPMTPRNARLNHPNRPKSQVSNQFLSTETMPASLGKIESYESEYVPYVDLQDMGNLYESIRNAPANTYRTPPRHNPPRCCDVPALQSPKNAVAPTQTLIATSNAGADYASSIQRMKNALADQQAGMAAKKELENNKLNQISQDDNKPCLTSACATNIISVSMQNGQALNAEASSSRYISQSPVLNGLESIDCAPTQTVYLNGLNNAGCASNVLTAPHPAGGVQATLSPSAHSFVHSKNNQNTGSSTTGGNTTSSNGPQLGQASSLALNKNGVHGVVSPACSYQFPENIDQCFGSTCSQCFSKHKDPKCHVCYGKTNPGYVNAGTAVKLDEDLMRFSDEEARNNLEALEQLRGVHRTSTVISIGPMCSNDSIVRSCSVGYLDLVDAQLVPCDVALQMLRRDAPNKRLVLVSRKTKRRKRAKPQQDVSQPSSKPPRLRNCGKSKSLDSSDIFPSNEQISAPPQLPEHVEEATGQVNSEVAENGAAERNGSTESAKEETRDTADKSEESNESNVVRETHIREKPGRPEAAASPVK